MKKNKWYFLNTGKQSGIFNMQCDEYLLDALINRSIDFPVLRVYAWSESTLSLGANQKMDVSSNKFFDFPTVKRLTGGMAVLHDISEITYSVVLDAGNAFKKTYYEIGEALISFLSTFGLKASYGYSSEKNYFNEFNCFDSETSADIVVNDFKVIGSAQYRKKSYILQHGSIKLDLISKLSGTNIGFSETVKLLKQAFESQLNIDFVDYCISDVELRKIEPQVVKI